MKREVMEIVRQRLERAWETLDEASLLLQNNHIRSAVNRLYYACFYAVSALLLIEGRHSTKHSGLIALFDRYWVSQDRIPKEWGRFYRRLYDRRQKSDYSDMASFSPDDVALWSEQTRNFITHIADKIKEYEI